MATLLGLSERDFARVARVVGKVEGESQAGRPPRFGFSSFAQPATVTFRNDSSETVPAFGVMRVTGGEFDASVGPYLLCDKPSSAYVRAYAVNEHLPVDADKFGQCRLTGVVRVAYDSGTPAVDELWGPKASQWTLSKGATGTGGTGTTLRADWGVVVAGIADATNKILLGQVVPYGRARMCLCQADNTTGTTLDKVDTVTAMDGGWCPTDEASDELTVTSGFETDVNSVGVIVYDALNDNWRPLDFGCPS